MKGGTRFIHVYATCPTGWRVPSEMCVKIARLAVQTNFFPLYEVENGNQYTLNYPNPHPKPIKDYMGVQGRFKHLTAVDHAEIQEIVDEDWALLNKKCSFMPAQKRA
jgi:pyruvate ferredoxin oxidoreductase beta subunit/2-oxoisovalerate ferredoxin oxidoreductase beta subunit